MVEVSFVCLFFTMTLQIYARTHKYYINGLVEIKHLFD